MSDWSKYFSGALGGSGGGTGADGGRSPSSTAISQPVNTVNHGSDSQNVALYVVAGLVGLAMLIGAALIARR